MTQVTKNENEEIYDRLEQTFSKKLEHLYKVKNDPTKKYVYMFGELFDTDELDEDTSDIVYKNDFS